MMLPAWMQSVLQLDHSGRVDAALDEMFDRIEPMLSGREYSQVDAILAAMPVEASKTLMLGLLSLTRPAAEHLPSRGQVQRRCRAANQ